MSVSVTLALRYAIGATRSAWRQRMGHMDKGSGLVECQLPGCWCHVAFVTCKAKKLGKPCKAINHGYRTKCWNCEGEMDGQSS